MPSEVDPHIRTGPVPLFRVISNAPATSAAAKGLAGFRAKSERGYALAVPLTMNRNRTSPIEIGLAPTLSLGRIEVAHSGLVDRSRSHPLGSLERHGDLHSGPRLAPRTRAGSRALVSDISKFPTRLHIYFNMANHDLLTTTRSKYVTVQPSEL